MLVCSVAALGAGAAPDELLAFGAAGHAPRAPWHWVGLPHQSKPQTRFSVVDIDGYHALRVESDQSYGNLVHALPAASRPGHLAWRWKLEQLDEAADLRSRAGDDTSLKLCVLWDLPLERVPFIERQLLRFARLQSRQPLPGATVCYVWDAHLAEGTVIASAYTRRLRYLVLRSGSAQLHQWAEERRDIAADFLQAFGDETSELPPPLAVGIGADTDNTHGHSLGYVADLRWLP